MICIIDYGMGNLHSVRHKLKKLNVENIISNDPQDIKRAEKLILPGVGHFAAGMKKLKALNLIDRLNEEVLAKKKPILGICLGMQLFTKHSEEGGVQGLGWFDADTVKFNLKDTIKHKVPHMGWNSISRQKESVLFDGIGEDELFYFVHSYYIRSNHEPDILSTTKYEQTFISSLERENIYATQFHPEKSHDYGRQLLKNFIEKI